MDDSEERKPFARLRANPLYPVVSLLLGLISGAAFLSVDYNVKPLWILTGPPAIIANILLGILGFNGFQGNIAAQVFVMALFIAYYFVLLLPTFLIRTARFADAPTPTHFYVMQYALLSMHALLTVLLFIMMRA